MRIRIWSKILSCLAFVLLAIYGGIFVVVLMLNNYRPILPPGFCSTSDIVAPEITIIGAATMPIIVGTDFTDPGATVLDDCDKVSLEITGTVDTSTIGSYQIFYSSTDLSGNHAEAIRTINVVPEYSGTIYLTFDDGPSEYTNELLDILKHYDVPATFFVTNSGSDATIFRAFHEGHAIGVHTASHNYSYIYSNTTNFWADFNTVKSRITSITGEAPTISRFPGGSSNTVSRNYDGGQKIMSKLSAEVLASGYSYFDWNVDSDDAGRATTTDEVYNNITNSLKLGGESVILQHDTKKFSIDAVAKVIEYGLAFGYKFKKLDNTSYSARHFINN